MLPLSVERTLVDIVLEVTFLESAIGEDDATRTVLDPASPFAFVHATVRPEHLALTVPLVVDVVSLVDVATGPCVHTLAVFLIALIFAFVTVAILAASRASPLGFTVFLPLQKVTCVNCSVRPVVFSFAMRLAVFEVACVLLAIGEAVGALAVLEACVPLTLILVSVGPLMHSVPVGFRVLPLPNVRVIVDTLPDSVPFFSTLLPLSVVDFAVLPGVNSLTMGFALLELAEVCISVRISFEALAHAEVVFPLTFILAAIRVLHCSFSVSFFIFQGAHVDCIFVSYFFVSFVLFQSFDVNFIGFMIHLLELEWQREHLDLRLGSVVAIHSSELMGHRACVRDGRRFIVGVQTKFLREHVGRLNGVGISIHVGCRWRVRRVDIHHLVLCKSCLTVLSAICYFAYLAVND